MGALAHAVRGGGGRLAGRATDDARGATGTVVGTMPAHRDTSEHRGGDNADRQTDHGMRPRRRLDRRTVAICVCVAAIAAMAAGLLASFVTDDDKGSTPSNAALTAAGDLDTEAVMSTGVVDFTGRNTTLAAYAGKGQPTVVNFFSTTCAPCVREMPAFERVHRSGTGVRFLGVDVQDQVGPARRLMKRTGITYDAVRDPAGDLLRAVGGAGLPTTVFIDGKGRIVDTHTGALTEQELRRLIERKLR